MGNCAGVDWASEKHDVLVADEAGEELLAATFAHDEARLRALCRALVRLQVELVAKVALGDQLRSELERFWPGPVGLFNKLDSQVSLAFLERYPSPVDARGLGEQRLAAFLARQHYAGRQKPTELLAKLRRAPEGRVGDAELAARRQLVLALVTTLKAPIIQIKALDRQIATAVRSHPDGEIFLSLFKDPNSVICAAELLAEIGDCRARYPTRDSLAADARPGCGRDRIGQVQGSACWGCNKRLRAAFCTLADSTRHWHPWARTATPPPPEPAATTTPARYAPSGALGAESSGAAGKTTPHTTPPATADSTTHHRDHSHLVGPWPTRRRPADGWALSPTRRPAGGRSVTASRHPLRHPRG